MAEQAYLDQALAVKADDAEHRPDSCWLSVAMPIHCGEAWLVETLESAAAQDCTGIEFILIDSGPDTRCGAIAASFADRLDIRYEHRPDVKPWTTKTNMAVERARAPHIAMLHQDDLWLPNRVATIRSALMRHPAAVMIVAPSHFIGPDGAKVGRWSLPFPRGLQSGRTIGRALLVQEVIALPAPVIRRDTWLAIGGLDQAFWYTADWDLYLKLAAAGPIAVLPEPTTGFRLHGTSLTMTGSRDVGDFRNQLQSVLDRHAPVFADRRDGALKRQASASVTINCALARVAAGDLKGWFEALGELLSLGPVSLWRYLHLSRLVDRALPRLRLRLAGKL